MKKCLNITSKRPNEDASKEENKCMFRKYDDSYLGLDFTYIKIDNVEPKGVVCLKVLTADSTLPNKLKRNILKVIMAH